MGGSVEKAVTEGRRMILEEKIKFVTVGIHSGAAVAVGNLGKEYKVLVIGGFATTRRLTGEAGHRYVGRANLSTVEIGRVMAEYLKGRNDMKRIATIAPDYEFGQHFVQDFLAASQSSASRHRGSPAGVAETRRHRFRRACDGAAGATCRYGGGGCVRRRLGQFPAIGARLRTCSDPKLSSSCTVSTR